MSSRQSPSGLRVQPSAAGSASGSSRMRSSAIVASTRARVVADDRHRRHGPRIGGNRGTDADVVTLRARPGTPCRGASRVGTRSAHARAGPRRRSRHRGDPGRGAGVRGRPAEAPTEAVPRRPVAVDRGAAGRNHAAGAAGRGAAAMGARPPFWDTGRVIVVAILVLVLGGGAGFLIGRSTADSGPATLADAVDRDRQGRSPRRRPRRSTRSWARPATSSARTAAASSVASSAGRLGSGGSAVRLERRRQRPARADPRPARQQARAGRAPPRPRRRTPAHRSSGCALEAAASGQTGAKVGQVTPGGPAADAGVRAGDVITAVDATAVADPAAVATAIRAHRAGDQITLTLTA